ncbi:hypothetical protein BJV82DRAFT_305313 [Fennellomyces sp. T-0311]|nr:hypothetical protein BJV82DRAFT_305313 [Fennellomyces sp. T-0311]
MLYFCYSCQTQTDVLTLPQPTCRRCYSDFVEEIEADTVHGEREWSDEDDTLASIWNTVFRDTLIGNDPLHEAESEDEYHYASNFGNDYASETAQEEANGLLRPPQIHRANMPRIMLFPVMTRMNTARSIQINTTLAAPTDTRITVPRKKWRKGKRLTISIATAIVTMKKKMKKKWMMTWSGSKNCYVKHT